MSRPVWVKNKSTIKKEMENARVLAQRPAPLKRWRPVWTKNKQKSFLAYINEIKIDEVEQISNDIEPYGELQNYDWIQFFNCTWHDVNVRGVGKIPPHTFLRIAENSYTKWYVNKVPVFETSYTTGLLPAKSPNKIYIVGQLVCVAAPDRDDLYIPYRVNHVDKYCQGIIQNPFYRAIAKYKKQVGIID
jgi:hypothetical protein